MVLHNILTCAGFSGVAGFLSFGSACMKSRLGLIILFFLIAIFRKWGGEEIGVDFNLIFAAIAGLVTYFLVVTFTGSMRLSFIIGLVAALVAGYGTGMFWGGSDDGYG